MVVRSNASIRLSACRLGTELKPNSIPLAGSKLIRTCLRPASNQLAQWNLAFRQQFIDVNYVEYGTRPIGAILPG